MAKVPEERSPKVPKASTVKLNRDNFEDVWWVARIEDKSPGELIEELCGLQASARRKRYAAEIAKLTKLDQETARLEEQARVRGEG